MERLNSSQRAAGKPAAQNFDQTHIMKMTSLKGLEMRARLAGLRAWNLWAAQGGLKADLKRGRPLSRIAARAKEIAQHKRVLGELFAKLDGLFPLGYSTRWDRVGGKGVGA